MARPMPRVPPVTAATFPEMDSIQEILRKIRGQTPLRPHRKDAETRRKQGPCGLARFGGLTATGADPVHLPATGGIRSPSKQGKRRIRL